MGLCVCFYERVFGSLAVAVLVVDCLDRLNVRSLDWGRLTAIQGMSDHVNRRRGCSGWAEADA